MNDGFDFGRTKKTCLIRSIFGHRNRFCLGAFNQKVVCFFRRQNKIRKPLSAYIRGGEKFSRIFHKLMEPNTRNEIIVIYKLCK